jgi:general stress protein 26
MDKKEAMARGRELVERSKTALPGTIGDKGAPKIKAMMNLKHDGLKDIWFSTNTSSKRVRELKIDNRACVYYLDETQFEGLLLMGTVEIRRDRESRKMLWSEGAEKYYPLGVEDPDYSVLNFTAERGNYYHALENTDFEIE